MAAIWRSAELGEAQTTPAIGGADAPAEHGFEHRLLGETVGMADQAAAKLRNSLLTGHGSVQANTVLRAAAIAGLNDSQLCFRCDAGHSGCIDV